ncbi:MAG: glycosyltransferase family 4 protein, partial [Candidatus Sericytochromatia bacterium]|nr:glycosyltransferase family 4 protein [Candidatus Sericytochromatia bacterium]
MKIAFLTTISRKLSGKIIDSEPVGGTHSAMINLASELAKSNHEVFVFSNCLGEEGIYSNVKYLMSNKIIRFSKENDIDILICVASESALKANIKAKKTILWLHNDYSPYWNHELSDIASQISEYMTVKCDKVVTVSKWQSDIVKKTFLIPENHIKIIANGINSELFEDHEHEKIIRSEKRLIYTTSPDRGLDLLLKFFPEIREKVPDVELHIYSSFKTWGKNDSSYIEIEKEIFKNTD